MPEYFYVSSSSDDSDYVPDLPHIPPAAHDTEASGLGARDPPPPPAPSVTQSAVARPDALEEILRALVTQQTAQAEAQRRQEERFARFQEEQLQFQRETLAFQRQTAAQQARAEERQTRILEEIRTSFAAQRKDYSEQIGG